MIFLLTLLICKHFVVDFLLQRPYQYMNKGTYGHPGGVLHSGIHAVSTIICCYLASPNHLLFQYFVMGWFDFMIHYHVDYAKVKITKKMKWTATTHEEFWYLLGLDQFLHSMTYVAILFFMFGNA